MLSGNQSSKHSQTAEYDSFEICLSGCCDDLLRMLRRLAAANPNNVKLEKFKYLSGTGVCSRSTRRSRGPVFVQGVQEEVGGRCATKGKEELSLARTTCLADKTNHPVERLSLNRSQCGSCSTKYDTSAGT